MATVLRFFTNKDTVTTRLKSYGFFIFKNMPKTLKKYLINSRAQSIVEYSVIFIAFALAVTIFIAKTRQGFEAHFQNAVNYILK